MVLLSEIHRSEKKIISTPYDTVQMTQIIFEKHVKQNSRRRFHHAREMEIQVKTLIGFILH